LPAIQTKREYAKAPWQCQRVSRTCHRTCKGHLQMVISVMRR